MGKSLTCRQIKKCQLKQMSVKGAHRTLGQTQCGPDLGESTHLCLLGGTRLTGPHGLQLGSFTSEIPEVSLVPKWALQHFLTLRPPS